jgi:hypothetical protein
MNSATFLNQAPSNLGTLTVANRDTDAREITLEELALVAGGMAITNTK